jgi:hypothetical protein
LAGPSFLEAPGNEGVYELVAFGAFGVTKAVDAIAAVLDAIAVVGFAARLFDGRNGYGQDQVEAHVATTARSPSRDGCIGRRGIEVGGIGFFGAGAGGQHKAHDGDGGEAWGSLGQTNEGTERTNHEHDSSSDEWGMGTSVDKHCGFVAIRAGQPGVSVGS